MTTSTGSCINCFAYCSHSWMILFIQSLLVLLLLSGNKIVENSSSSLSFLFVTSFSPTIIRVHAPSTTSSRSRIVVFPTKGVAKRSHYNNAGSKTTTAAKTTTTTITATASSSSRTTIINSTTRSKNSNNSSNKSPNSNNASLSVLEKTLYDWFQGDFDNYQQVLEDRAAGLLPKEGGGHEHIHCTLVPLDTATSRLAAFYFDGNPKAIFRFRYYHLIPRHDNNTKSGEEEVVGVDTVLYTLNPSLEQQLRACSDNPIAWPRIFRNFQIDDYNNTLNNNSHNDPRIQLLPGCDVRWSFALDPIQHSYTNEYYNNDDGSTTNKNEDDVQYPKDGGIHAVMVHGECLVDSQMKPGTKILIKDQLSLYPHQLYIHDRGYDPTTGEYIYGNHREVPYILHRVSTFQNNNHSHEKKETSYDNRTSAAATTTTTTPDGTSQKSNRTITNTALAWTMGSKYRTDAEYNEKIMAMGGPSVNIPNLGKAAQEPKQSSST